MRAFGVACLIAIVAVAGAACGGKKDEAKPAEQAAQQAAGAPQDLAKSMEQFGSAMQQMQKGPSGENIEPVDFTKLQELFPAVSGWEREEPRGESMTMPVRFSEAETAYTKGEARIEVKIVDTAMSQMLTVPYQMFLASGYSTKTSTGYEKAVSIAGQPGWEKWDSEAKRAEVGLIVGQRFVVTVGGSNTDTKTVHDVLGKLDLGRLAGLK